MNEIDPLNNNLSSRNAVISGEMKHIQKYTLNNFCKVAAKITSCSRKDYCLGGLI